MSELTPQEIHHLADLARINLTDEEKTRLVSELPKIVGFIDILTDVQFDKKIEDVKTITSINELRIDEVSGERLTLEELARLAPDWRDGYNIVPPVFGEAQNEG